MPRTFGRLPFLSRRSTSSDRLASDHPTKLVATADPDVAPVGPPVLLPATIVSQVLFDATEMTPVWARPRPDPESAAVPAVAAVPAEPAARKRTRRASTGGAAKTARTTATPRRARNSDRSPNSDG